MADLKGFDAAFPPTSPVPSGYQWAGVYVGGINAMRVTPLAEQHALSAAGLALLPIYVGRNQCPNCASGGMTTAQGTTDGQEFVKLAEARGFAAPWLLAFDWEANTEKLPGFADYANAAGKAVQAAGHLVAHYGTTTILDQITAADAVWLTYWTNNTTDDGLTRYWRGKYPRFAWQWGGSSPLDFDLATQEFVDALSGGIVAGPEQPVTDSETFPETGKTLAHGFYAFWVKNGGLPVFGLPITDEQTETLSDGQSHTVQYTERARLEWWPGTDPANFDVRLGLLGRELLDARTQLTAASQGYQRVIDAQPLAAALADTATRLVKVLS